MKWHSKTLDELCSFKNGLWKGKKEPFIHVGVIRNTNFTKNGQLDDSDIAYLDVESKQYASRKLEYGDLILEKSGGGPKQPVGRVIPFEKKEGEFSFSNFTSIIRILNKEELDFLFLHRYLHFLYVSGATERMQKHSTGIRNLQLKEYKEIEIPLPPIAEQKRIVAILNEAFAGIDAAIANTEKNLANARELFESYLNTVFTDKDEGWDEKTLKQVCIEFGRGKSKHRPRNDPKLYGGSYPFIQTGDVRNCEHLIKTSSQSYNEIGLAQSKLWPKGTICITIAANIAETGILDFDACFPDSIIGMVVDEDLTSNAYVEYLLQSVKARIKAKGKGSAQDNINLATFEKEYFPFPDLNKQSEIVENLHELSTSMQRLESIYQQKLNLLNELKQSLLQKAFSGELTAKADNLKEEAVA